MKLADNAIYWVASSHEPLFHGQVAHAGFSCSENRFDVERMEITCEDSTYAYSFTLIRSEEKGFVGNCTKWDLREHTFAGEQSVSCALINSTEGRALLLSGTPMEAHGRNDLYWMIRIKDVVRNVASRTEPPRQ